MATLEDKPHLQELAQKIEKLYLENLLQDDLTISEMIALHIIASLKKPTIVEFANSIKISQSNATYVIHKLVRKGYVKKEPSTTDGRVFLLSVTDEYNSKLNFYEKYLKDIFDEAIDALDEDELSTIEKVEELIQQQLAER